MANISKINVNNNAYYIKDAVARNALGTFTGSNAVPTALNNKVGYADYRTVEESGATKHYIYFYKNDSDAPTNASTIPSTYLCKIDAAPFIKDGMVSKVEISNGDLVITWNSDSTGVTTPTKIHLTDIFNPANYYDKDTIDGMIEDVEAGQIQVFDNLTTQDSTNALSANQGYELDTKKANKSELSITAVTGKIDRKNVQLKTNVSQEFLIAHQDISGKADKNEMNITAGTGTNADKTTIQLKSGMSATVLTSHQDISGKANKSEMSVTAGTGNDADKTTIQLKNGTSATVLTTHQDISGKEDKAIEVLNWISTNIPNLPTSEADARALTAEEIAAIAAVSSETNWYINAFGIKLPVVTVAIGDNGEGAMWAAVMQGDLGVGVVCEWIHKTNDNKYWKEITTTTLALGSGIPDELKDLSDDSTHRVVTDTQINAWNAKYDKPNDGIPKTDLASAVQTSLGKADTAVQDSSYVHTDNNFTTTLKDKLDSIAAGAEVNVQSDWNQTTTTADDYIKNKPTNVSAFTNDAGYQTSSQVTSAISSAVSGSYTESTETLSLTLPTFTTA